MVFVHERRLRSDLLKFSRLSYERHLLVGLDGNLSARLHDDMILCTRAGCHKGLLTDDDLLVTDMNGRKLRGRGEPTSELMMHLACYHARPDVRAVVHAHPPTCIAFTVAGVSMARCVLPEVVLTLGTIPTLEYATTGTKDLAKLVGSAVKHHDGVLMDRHGAVTVGPTLLDAFCKLETMEHTAKIMLNARALGRVQELDSSEAHQLRAMGLKRYGGPPEPAALPTGGAPAEACRDCSGCGNPRQSGLAPPAGFSIARIGR